MGICCSNRNNINHPEIIVYIKTLSNNTFLLDITSLSTTIASCKIQIEDTNGNPAKYQRLLFHGQELDDDKPLSYYNIINGSVLNLLLQSPATINTNHAKTTTTIINDEIENDNPWAVLTPLMYGSIDIKNDNDDNDNKDNNDTTNIDNMNNTNTIADFGDNDNNANAIDHAVDDNVSDQIYVIGNNVSGAFGIGGFGYTTGLTRFNKHPKYERITRIYSGCSHTIYSNQHENTFWISGDYGNGDNISAHLSEIKFPLEEEAGKWESMRIRKVCMNVNGKCTFWITDKNKVYGYGRNTFAALGLGHTNYIDRISHIPFFDNNVSNVMDIQTAGSNYSFALCSQNSDHQRISMIIEYWARKTRIYCPDDIVDLIANFENGKYHLYSVGFTLMGTSFNWKKIKSLDGVNITKIATGLDHSLFLEPNGTVWVCGENKYGQLGLGHLYKCNLPTKIQYFVQNEIVITDIKCGENHSLAMDINGNVYSWGHNGAGQCGDGSSYHLKKPKWINFFNGQKIKEIGCGGYHSFCKTFTDKYFLFGGNKYNECITYISNQQIVKTPYCINRIVKEKCKGKEIKSVHLGKSSTKLIVCYPNVFEGVTSP